MTAETFFYDLFPPGADWLIFTAFIGGSIWGFSLLLRDYLEGQEEQRRINDYMKEEKQ